MSRLDDIIDLIQTTNEVYFITAPGRLRTAFILVDDIIELALKSFLEERGVLQNRMNFPDVVQETKNQLGTGHSAIPLLDAVQERHRLRNNFYHDQTQAGLTINDERCLRAMCEMFDLMEHLFPDWLAHVQANNTVRCQIGVLRLKRAAFGGQREVVEPYDDALEQLKRNHRYDIERRSVEHSLVHTVSDRFFRALREQFENKIAELQNRIIQIDNMRRPQRKHHDERADKQRLVEILQQQLDEINALLGTP